MSHFQYDISYFRTFPGSFFKIPSAHETTIHQITKISNHFEIYPQMMNISLETKYAQLWVLSNFQYFQIPSTKLFKYRIILKLVYEC